MSAREPLLSLFGIHFKTFSKEETILLEADTFLRIYCELINIFKKEHREYFYFMKFTLEMETIALEKNFIRLIINDILSTGEYNLQGIALYTGIHEDILCELASGLNNKPLAIFLLKIISLHTTVRKDLYITIKKKLMEEYLSP